MTLSGLANSGRISLFELEQITTFGHRFTTLRLASHAATRSFPNGVPASILRGRKVLLPSLLQPGPNNAQLHFPPHYQDPHNIALNPLSDASSALTRPLCGFAFPSDPCDSQGLDVPRKRETCGLPCTTADRYSTTRCPFSIAGPY